MLLVRSALIATAACLIGAAAYAQPATTDQAPPAGAQSMPQDNSAPATSTDMSAPGSDRRFAANTFVATVGANGAQVIASQPVPDTPANRAAFGQPLSHAGKHTKPAGN